jgi:hypothetical protein
MEKKCEDNEDNEDNENNENYENCENNKNCKMLMKIIYTTEQLQEYTNYFIDDINDIIDVHLTELDKSKNLKEQQLELQEIKNKMYSLKSIMNKNIDFVKICFRNNLMKICNHNWIVDYIDSLTYECKRIEYCNKCDATKNCE